MEQVQVLDHYLKIFEKFQYETDFPNHTRTVISDHIFTLTPKGFRNRLSSRPIDICVLGLTHGNEVAGISVITEILRMLASNFLDLPLSLAFALGDVSAAKANRRFVEADLNRSFGLTQAKYPAEMRAKVLQSLFENSFFAIDLHQTQGPSAEPFFISRFDNYSLAIFQSCLPYCSAVTYGESNFSETGMTTINYHLAMGGKGFGVELGAKGFDPWQTEYGVSLILKLCKVIQSSSEINSSTVTASINNVYTFDQILISKTGSFKLVEGLVNFSIIEKDKCIGFVDGGQVSANRMSRVLFPKYPGTSEKIKVGSEVCRLLKPVEHADLTRFSAKGADF